MKMKHELNTDAAAASGAAFIFATVFENRWGDSGIFLIKNFWESFKLLSHNKHFEIFSITKQKLNNHISEVHEKAKPYECNLCNMKFARKDTMIGHMSTIAHKRKTADS